MRFIALTAARSTFINSAKRALVLTVLFVGTGFAPAQAQSFTDPTPVAVDPQDRTLLIDAWRKADWSYRELKRIQRAHPDDHEAIWEAIRQLQRDVDDLEDALQEEERQRRAADGEHDRRLGEIEEALTYYNAAIVSLNQRVLCSQFGLDLSLGISPPIPGIAPALVPGGGLYGGVCLEDATDGMALLAEGGLSTHGYDLGLYYLRYKKRGIFEYGYVLGGGSAFMFDGGLGAFAPKYDAFQGGARLGGYGSIRLFRNRKKGTSTHIGLMPVVELGMVGTVDGSAPVGSVKMKLRIFKKKQYGRAYDPEVDGTPAEYLGRLRWHEMTREERREALEAEAARAEARPVDDGTSYVLEDIEDEESE